ncbi:hypothetical protein GON03_07740 [Nocardioides sp. MAH-18]|uniref:Solute-binding protein family 5 domain-containing protein n=1 Tax=Nocardioides agri TaxID=2682843 RepID=A0A6L6XP17_9ACTN|nr:MULTISPECIES: hypothetical protein [unclassified Nocardioides]MBA2954209.1 hypothetical protein [Nocardioides sp. CGMCC 1.13656]MVQ49071.1 hypothetical protein [Nocardioides sp. MAH-18]
MTGRRRRQVAHTLFAAALLASCLAVVAPALTSSARAVDGGAVTRTVQATRVFYDRDGNAAEVVRQEVELQVAQTTELRGRQEIHVAWSGAVPTGGVVGDPRSSDARNQEFPFVLLQCRGVDTTGSVPDGQTRLTPETCWTQTSPERYFPAASHTPAWRFDADAAPEDRAAVVGRPATLPPACSAIGEQLTARWLPFRAAGGTTYYGGPDPGVGCTPQAPESDDAESGGMPSNTTYGITGADGTGATDFAVWTAAENASLGCSAAVDCALVAVPIVGLSCDAWGTRLPAGSPQTTKAGVPLSTSQLTTADATCRRTGAYAPGAPRSSTTTDQAVRGSLWWSPSNWRNRITVPLGFAQTGAVCDAVSKEPPLEIMGSTALNELTASWRPKFCTTDGLFTFTHVQQADSLARTLVNSGEIDAALTSAPKASGYSRPVVQAPLAFTGFAIAFNIDDANHRRRERLNLNARLVAKLLTTSYAADPVVRDNHPSIGGNPYNLTLDPEFRALNPGLAQSSNLEAAAALQLSSASSDLTWALTSWINADPEARAWLDGTPDPWGMTVNANYLKVALPVDNWTNRDAWIAPQSYQDGNACYAKSPTPFMQLIGNQPGSLSTVVLDMQFASSAVSTICRFDGYDPTTLPLRTQGRQTVGYRFVLGLVSLSAARRYNLRTAALQTTASDIDGAFTVAGRTFVEPDLAGLQAAAGLLAPSAGTWAIDDAKISTPAGRAAYPGAVPVSAVIPTRGLDQATATKLAKLLCYSRAEGQVSGPSNGQLPAGYLPVTAASGLAAQSDYVLSAIAAVRAQAGAVPSLTATPPDESEVCDFTASTSASPTPTPTPTPTSSPTASAAPTASPTATPTAEPSPTGTPSPAPASGPVVPPTGTVPSAGGKPTKPSSGPSEPPTTEAATVLTAGESSLFGRLGVPGLLLLALGCALAGTLVRWFEPISRGVASAGPAGRGLARRGRSTVRRWRR